MPNSRAAAASSFHGTSRTRVADLKRGECPCRVLTEQQSSPDEASFQTSYLTGLVSYVSKAFGKTADDSGGNRRVSMPAWRGHLRRRSAGQRGEQETQRPELSASAVQSVCRRSCGTATSSSWIS